MRLGLSGGGTTTARAVAQAVDAERDGFTSLWYTSGGGDPVATMAAVGLATSTIELGTAVLPTYLSHPVLMAQRAAGLTDVVGRSTTLGLGPSHHTTVEGAWGLSFAHPGQHTEEYVAAVTGLLGGEDVHLDGRELRVHASALHPTHPVPVLVAALAPRLLRVAGERTDGTVLWLANARAVEAHVVPRITAAAAAASRPAPRIVAGVPVAVHDDVAEAREAAAEQFGFYERLPNYQRILGHGGLAHAADAAIVGDEATVAAQLQALLDAGATDLWVPPFAVGSDRAASRARTRALLVDLAT